MRLIDADELLKYMENTEISQYVDDLNNGNDNYNSTPLYDFVKEMKTAYDIEKIISELEKQHDKYLRASDDYEKVGNFEMAEMYSMIAVEYTNAIEIVKKEVEK